MLHLSEIVIQNPQVNSFTQLCEVIRTVAEQTRAFHLNIDIKPNYGDTPADWEDKVEAAFSGVSSVFGARKFTTEED